MKRDQQLVSYFLSALNRQYGSSYRVVRWPDENNRQTPAVEAVASDASGETVAVEHTLIQPFEGERLDTERFMRVFGKLEGNVDLIKPGYNVDVIVRAGAIPTGLKWEATADRVLKHIQKIIPVRGEGRTDESIEGLPFALSITLGVSSHDLPEEDHVWVSRYEGPDTLKQVVRIALERKLPKLVAEKASRRILLLEKADHARGHSDIRKAIDVLSPDFPELAKVDEIWLVITTSWDREDTLFFFELCPNVMDRRLQMDLRTSLTTALGVRIGIQSATPRLY
jgi:hypothetical protein